MKEEKLTLKQLKNYLAGELEDEEKEIRESDNPEDYINEIIDNVIPVYNYDILEVAMDELGLATGEPEIYGFDGKHTAINAIIGNIYEELRKEAYDWAERNGIEL